MSLQIRSIFLGAAIAVAAVGNAVAENWYVISASRSGAVLMDVDSRTTAPSVTVSTRLIHPGIQEVQTHPIVASQATFEFDCAGNRMRTVEFSAVDVDGHVPDGFRSSKVREWEAADKDNSKLFKAFACDGKVPPIIGSYKDFTDIEAKYLMWLGDPDAGDFALWKPDK